MKEPETGLGSLPDIEHLETQTEDQGNTNLSYICRVCGRKLSSWKSVKRGIGPVCWKNLLAKRNLDDEEAEE